MNVNFVLIERVLSLVSVDILDDIHSSFGVLWIYIIGLADTSYSDNTSYSDGLAIFTQHTYTFCCESLERLVKPSYVWLRCLLSSSDLSFPVNVSEQILHCSAVYWLCSTLHVTSKTSQEKPPN